MHKRRVLLDGLSWGPNKSVRMNTFTCPDSAKLVKLLGNEYSREIMVGSETCTCDCPNFSEHNKETGVIYCKGEL